MDDMPEKEININQAPLEQIETHNPDCEEASPTDLQYVQRDSEAEQEESLLGLIDDEFLQEDEPAPTVESVIEAILFASDESISPSRLVTIVGISSVTQVKEAIENLNNNYKIRNSAFQIEKIAGGYQMLTHTVYNNWLRKLIRERKETKLTQASLETLAIIAYKQPIIRADVESIRGVASGEMIRGLMNKGLVKITGRAEILGRPILYGTTKKFLEVFGLNSVSDLPKVEELKKPTIF